MQPDKTDSTENSDEIDYVKLGVPPPSHDEHGTEEDISQQLGKKNLHEWRQKGAVLYCISCPWEHATEPRFINHILQGTDKNGMPIMRLIK